MKKAVLLILIILGLLILVAGFFIFANNKEENVETNLNSSQLVDCGMIQNPSCFSNRFSACLPVTGKLTATDGSKIDITILGYVNETCHLQREVNDVTNLNCYFPKGTNLTWDLIDQTFGNDKGMQAIVDSSCA